MMDRHGADAIANTHLVLFPQRDLMCETIVEQEGLSGLVQLHVLSIDLIPLDKDFLSLCYKPFYADYHLNQIYTCIPWITQSIMRLEQMFGPIPISSDRCVYGAAARDVYELLKERRADPGYLEQLPPRSVFKSMFLFDRRRDLVRISDTIHSASSLLVCFHHDLEQFRVSLFDFFLIFICRAENVFLLVAVVVVDVCSWNTSDIRRTA